MLFFFFLHLFFPLSLAPSFHAFNSATSNYVHASQVSTVTNFAIGLCTLSERKGLNLLVILTLKSFYYILEVIIDYGSAFVTYVDEIKSKGAQFPGRDAPDKIKRGG